jgi:glyoxylase-like metal-dependent hydrolase (beta-lactamase superfamily II)
MLRKRILTAAPFAMLATGAFLLTAQPNSVKKIAEGVWFREGDIKNEGHCNNIIIEMKDYLIVIDANFPSGAKRVIDDAKKLSSKPIKYVFDTHHHGDHAYGNSVWTKAGATTLAHANVVAEMEKYEPTRWQQTAKERKDVGALNEPTVQKPMKTFTTSPFLLTDGSRKVEFHHFGWAHTRGDGFAFLPAEKILCTGDAVVNGPYNYTADGNVGNWPNVVKAAQKLNPTKVLPGHGPAGGPEVLSGELAFVNELMRAVKAAKASGKKLDQIVTMKDGKPVGTTLKLNDAVKNWVGDFLPAQVYDTWMEVEKGQPRGALKL